MEANGIVAALDSAVEALRGGVRRLGVEAALPVIVSWEERLTSLEIPELMDVCGNLALLRTQLETDDFDPAAVGRLLMGLGEQTQAVAAGDVGAPVADQLTRLSVILARQGNALLGGASHHVPGR